MIRSATQAALVHGLFEYAGMALGAALYRRARRQSALPAMTGPGPFALMVGLLLGAGLGNKLAFALERPDLVLAWWHGGPWAMGQSVIGGLLGGLLGIEAAKALTHQPASTGDLMIRPIAAGLIVGRIGCTLAGLHDDTWGRPTALPWGLDAGDGVPRHPAPLYEMLVVAGLALLLTHPRTRARLAAVPGLAFKLFLAAYLAWRLGIDGLKPVLVPFPLGASGLQWLSALALAVYLPLTWRAWRRLPPHAATGFR